MPHFVSEGGISDHHLVMDALHGYTLLRLPSGSTLPTSSFLNSSSCANAPIARAARESSLQLRSPASQSDASTARQPADASSASDAIEALTHASADSSTPSGVKGMRAVAGAGKGVRRGMEGEQGLSNYRSHTYLPCQPACLPACLPTYVLTYRKTSSFQKRGVDRRRGRAKQAGLKVG